MGGATNKEGNQHSCPTGEFDPVIFSLQTNVDRTSSGFTSLISAQINSHLQKLF